MDVKDLDITLQDMAVGMLKCSDEAVGTTYEEYCKTYALPNNEETRQTYEDSLSARRWVDKFFSKEEQEELREFLGID